MKLYGSLKELVAAIFRKDSQEITLRPNQSTTYTAARDVQLPPQDANSVIVSETATQTLTNKSLTSPAITTPTGLVKGDVGLGNVDNTSDATKNAATATLTNKTLSTGTLITAGTITGTTFDADLNTITNIEDADIKAGAAIAATKIGAGSVDNTEFGYLDGVTSAIQTQIDSKASTSSLTGHTSASTVHGITGVVVGTTDSQTLTNKSITSPTFGTDTIFTHIATPANPSSGFLKLYAKSDNKLYTKDSTGAEVQVGSGAGGGSINYIGNPDAESSTTGWATYADAAAATPVDGTGGSPVSTFARNTTTPLRGNADFLWTKGAANRQGEGFSYNFSISVADKSKKLSISFDLLTSANYVAGDMRVYVYDVTNATLITPSSVSIPAITGTFNVTFDSTTSTSYRLIVHTATTSSLAYTINFDNFQLGPGTITQGAAVSGWQPNSQSVSPSGTGGTVAGSGARWRRVGSMLECEGFFTMTGAGSGGTDVSIPLPVANLVLDANGSPSGVVVSDSNVVGFWNGYNVAGSGASFKVAEGIRPLSTTTLGFQTGASVVSGSSLASGAQLYYRYTVPIAEWAGSGTVNLGPGAQEYFVANSGTTTTAGGTNAASNTVYGPAGATIIAVDSTALSNTTQFVMNLLQPLQSNDLAILEYASNGSNFVPTASTSLANANQGSSFYGADISAVTSTTLTVSFGNGGFRGNNATYAGAGQAWSALVGSARWRVRVAKASSPVGFGLAGTDGSSGLYQAGRAPGQITGAAIATGFIGEILSSITSTSITVASLNLASITLTPGVWTVSGGCRVSADTAPRFLIISISTVSATHDTNLGRTSVYDYNTGTGVVGGPTFPRTINVSSNTTVYLVGSISSVSGLSGTANYIEAVRIA